MEQSLRKLGVERVTKEDVQKMQWEVLEAKIGNWIHYMRIAVSANSPPISDSSFFLCFPCTDCLVLFVETGQAFISCREKSI